MDNFAIEQDWTMHCNIMSRRCRIQRIRKARDKKLRTLDKEYRKLYNNIRDLGYEKLEHPIRCGYKRLFILAEDTRHCPNTEFYQNILDKINTIRYSPNKEFDRKRTSKKWRKRKRFRKEQTLLEPSRNQFHNTLKFTEDEQRMFYEINYYDYTLKKCCTKYVFSEPWRFVLRIRPHWITEIKRKDALLEQALSEVEAIVSQHKNTGRLTKLKGGNSYAWKKVINKKSDRDLYAYNSLKQKPLYLIMEEYYEEKQLWEYDQKN